MATQWISPTWRMPEESNQSKFENYSLEFPGTGGYVTCTSAGDLFGNNEAFTFSFWCKVNTMAAYKAFFDFSPNSGFGLLALRTQSTSVIELLKSGASLGTYSFSDTTSFHNFCIVYDKTNIKLYIDNIEVISSAQTNMGDFTGLDLHIANGYFLTSLLDSNFSDVCLFKYAASSDQRNYLYNSGTPQNPMAISGQPPVAYYPLGGSSTGSADDPANTLTVPNSSVPSATVFEFSSDVINTNSLGISGANSRTISCWFNADSTSNQNIIGFGAASQGNYFTIAIYNSNIFAHTWNTGGVGGDLYGSAVTAGKWHLAVMTYDGTNLKISLDGGTYATTTASLNTTNSIFKIGSSYYTTWNNFSGKISNTKVWNTDLTQSEVETLYNNGQPLMTGTQPQAANLKGWWKMNVDTSTWDGSNWVIGDSTANYSSALNFDGGINNGININNDSSLEPLTSFTLSCWIKSETSQNSYAYPVYKESSDYNHVAYGFYLQGSQTIATTLTTSGVVTSDNIGDLRDDKWHHIVQTYDGSGMKVYLDGVQSGSTKSITGNVDYSTTQPKLYIGNTRRTSPSGYFSFKGNISNVALFNTAIDAAGVSTLFNSGTPQTSISYSPTSWWKLDNITTGIQDSVGSNNGTIVGSVTTIDSLVSTLNGTSSGMTTANLVTSDLTRSIPYSSYSMEFDGTADVVTIGSTSLGITSAISISAWVKTTDTASSYKVIFCEDNTSGTNRSWNLFVNSSGYLACIIWHTDGSLDYLIRSTQYEVQDGNWHHVAVTFDGTTDANGFKIYVDGSPESMTATSTGIRTTANLEPAIGGLSTSGGWYWPGSLSNIGVWSSALTQDQILTIYNGGVPNSLSSLSPISWWSLAGDSYYDGNDWICPDLGSANNNGTSNGMGGTELVGDGPGSTANGIATNMDIPGNLQGNAPNSSKNAFSVNMNSADRVEDVAPTP